MKDSISDALLISSFFGKDVVLEVLHTYIQKLRTQEATPDSVGWTALRNMARYNPAFFQQSAVKGAHVRLLDDIAFLINLEISTLLTTHSDIWRSHMKSIAALQLSLICTLDVLEALCGMSVGSDGDEYFKIGSFSSAIAHSVVLLCLKLEPLVVDDRRLFGRTAKKGGARDSDDSDRSGDEGGGGDDEEEAWHHACLFGDLVTNFWRIFIAKFLCIHGSASSAQAISRDRLIGSRQDFVP